MADAKKETKEDAKEDVAEFELDDLGNQILDADGNPIPKKKKKSKKKFIIIGVVALLAIGGGAAAMLMGGGEEEKAEATKEGGHAAAENKEGGKEEAKLDEHGNPVIDAPVYMNLPDITVNLNSTSRRTHYINLKITLELAKAADVASFEAQMPKIIDTLNTYLRELRREDLQGTAGLIRLENEMLLRLSKTIKNGEIKDILFREILIQ